DTEKTPESAARAFEAVNPDEELLPNEVLSRREMQDHPPHLLLTNYAMLEYLLLRPEDVPLFASETWKYIVVDEAHVYNGTQAAELSMLLRRLKERVSPNSQPQCIATSATVGDDEKAVCRFASDLFSAPFEWTDGEPDRQDLVKPARAELSTASWEVEEEELQRLAASDHPESAILKCAKNHGHHFTGTAEALAS